MTRRRLVRLWVIALTSATLPSALAAQSPERLSGSGVSPGVWGVRVQAAPPADAGLAAASTTYSPVRMRSDALDSVRVDLQLASTL